MIVTVLRNAGNPDAPQGATVDASGWGNLDLMLQMGYVRPATAAEHAAYQVALSAPATEPEPTPSPSSPTPEPEPAPATEPAPPAEAEPVESEPTPDPEPAAEPAADAEPVEPEPAKPTVRRSR